MSWLPHHHQLESENVWDVEAKYLQRKVILLAVEDRNGAAVWDLCRLYNTIPAQIPHGNPPRDLCLLEDTKVDVTLRHTV